jgi:hypothetical protein
MKKCRPKIIFSLLITCLVAGCGSSGSSSGGSKDIGSSQPAAAEATAVPTSSTATTTTTMVPVSPKKSLQALAKSLMAIDYSRISQGDCGTFAVIVTKQDLWFYEYDWDYRQWVDKSYLLGDALGNAPIRVTTRDYNFDDVNDFLVAYGDNLNVNSSGREYGGIFAYYPYASGELKCKWGWVDLVGGVGVSKVMDWLGYDDDAGVIRAQDFYDGGGRTFGTLSYSPDDHAYFFTPDDEWIGE